MNTDPHSEKSCQSRPTTRKEIISNGCQRLPRLRQVHRPGDRQGGQGATYVPEDGWFGARMDSPQVVIDIQRRLVSASRYDSGFVLSGKGSQHRRGGSTRVLIDLVAREPGGAWIWWKWVGNPNILATVHHTGRWSAGLFRGQRVGSCWGVDKLLARLRG